MTWEKLLANNNVTRQTRHEEGARQSALHRVTEPSDAGLSHTNEGVLGPSVTLARYGFVRLQRAHDEYRDIPKVLIDLRFPLALRTHNAGVEARVSAAEVSGG